MMIKNWQSMAGIFGSCSLICEQNRCLFVAHNNCTEIPLALILSREYLLLNKFRVLTIFIVKNA